MVRTDEGVADIVEEDEDVDPNEENSDTYYDYLASTFESQHSSQSVIELFATSASSQSTFPKESGNGSSNTSDSILSLRPIPRTSRISWARRSTITTMWSSSSERWSKRGGKMC